MTRVIKSKISSVLAVRDSWPLYLSLEEDIALRSNKWLRKYVGQLPIFHDNTGLLFPTPSDSYLLRLTYSSYYAGNVAKGGVFIQLSGWLGTLELYPGGMSDSKYLNETGILENQKRIQEDMGDVQIINVLDRGYRSTKAAWRNGQFVLQPTFAHSDKKFLAKGTLQSASIASDRSGNECAVKVCKSSSYLKTGIRGNKDEDVERMCDIWLTYSFQANFMYESVM